ncbi:hypothetical protein [Bacillus sp. B-jedd]|uniref:hypothetical protein n=1 Tax=Bacillus sp. B-jedd TaxID=1476857 RepID=UPI0005156C21|nr:hypothetical protein [Bacillus sp. B-jedd]CEG29712.1 hypothetical protein BN1002_04671 [Bacillus sp. B-jedd]
MAKRILIILLVSVSFAGLGAAVYASPINQKVSQNLDEFIDSKFGNEKPGQDPCLLNKDEKKENCIH